jgi:hypothetical protein
MSDERRRDHATAEKIDDALRTRRAFDEHTALRFLQMHQVCANLALSVMNREFGDWREARRSPRNGQGRIGADTDDSN